MNADLDALIRLHRAESDLRQAEKALAEIPTAKAALAESLAGERGRWDAAKSALDASQKARKQHETAVQDLETKRSKYKGQLMEVKTNKEYTAMLHEIEGVERDIRAREDQILAEMEQAEGLQAEAKKEEGLFKKEEEKWKAEGRVLDERAKALEAEVAKLSALRDEVAKAVPQERLELFQRVARKRGDAVAEAKDSRCEACHVRLRPQMFMELKRNEDIVQCPSCGRVLYYEPPVPVVVPTP
jgi:predicted  nucleic acid-binding Zn-ribbon protein